MPYRFVHAADIHLDSPLRSLALRDAALADLVGNATRRAFVGIVDLCLDEGVDALLLGGDLYDGDQTSMKTARFLADQLNRLDRAGIRTFVIRGNHDALSRITRELTLPDGVKVFGGRAEAVRIEASSFDVVVHGLSFREPHAAESLLPKFRPPVADAVNIGLMHTSLGDSKVHSNYAPCTVAELQAAGFHYWALGHIHKGSVGQARPGAPAVVMPGIPQGRDVNEAGLKGVALVTIGDDRDVTVEHRPTSVAQFERVVVDLDGVANWAGVARVLEKALGLAREAAPAEHLVARLMVTGRTPLAWRLRREMDLLKVEADSRAAALGSVWIETVEGTGLVPARAPSLPGDPVAELRRLIDEDVLRSHGFRAEFEGIAEELRGALPPECRALLGTDEAGFAAALDALAAEGAEDVLARLGAGAQED